MYFLCHNSNVQNKCAGLRRIQNAKIVFTLELFNPYRKIMERKGKICFRYVLQE